MPFILAIVFVIAFIVSIVFRVLVTHPFKTIKYSVLDLINYFRHKEYNRLNTGELNCYFAHFGGGKTLSVVHHISSLYHRYNNKPVWDSETHSFFRQEVHILSNVHLTDIPYEELTSLSQIVTYAWNIKDIDKEQHTRTCILVLLDEASSQLNSRSFKTNIDPDFLNTLVTSRHFNMSLFYTSQKFKLVDALLRAVTQKAIHCHKVWRVMVWSIYSADELEYASDPTMVKPLGRTGWFITNKTFQTYDTLATVEKLKKSVDANEMLSAAEILALRGQLNADNDAVSTPSRKLNRFRRGGRKRK